MTAWTVGSLVRSKEYPERIGSIDEVTDIGGPMFLVQWDNWSGVAATGRSLNRANELQPFVPVTF